MCQSHSAMLRPKVSDDRRHLVLADGTPFFWLADTAWELFHRLNREEIEHYLTVRAEQGFNVIQAVALAEIDGIHDPNAYGERPLLEDDTSRLNEPYWAHVDWAIDRAAEHGLYIALLPTWGDKVNQTEWGVGPVLFDAKKARAFGKVVGRRYATKDNVIWVNGGDRVPGDKRDVWVALAEGLLEGDDTHERLMTFHPAGARSSAADFHDEDWLDMNMLQTGHNTLNYGYLKKMLLDTYHREPTKPVLDAEPNYENHPVDFNMLKGYFDEGHVRQSTYTTVFSGGCGVTYGCHAVWQMARDKHVPVNNPISHWHYSLGLPGARQMHHLKDLMLSLPFLELAPITDGPLPILATPDRKVVAVHTPEGEAIELADGGKAEWFDPATGGRQLATKEGGVFTPPSKGGRVKDWVLIVRN
ncbi:DUF4038 domain-containing protein [bacterium]|nr:MAG: DUF4038 domain-containing protein [bacterium]